MNATIWWVRRDLRLGDNPALTAACRSGLPLLPVYCHAPEDEKPFAPGAASRWWLHHSLNRLDESLRALGSRLLILRGSPAERLPALARAVGAREVFAGKLWEPASRAQEKRIGERLTAEGARLVLCDGNLLLNPEAVKNRQGRPYQVFTPFFKNAFLAADFPRPDPPPRSLPPLPPLSPLSPLGNLDPPDLPPSLPVAALELQPRPDWAFRFPELWEPGERGAAERLNAFLRTGAESYPEGRDIPSRDGVSGLSPHLHFGEIAPLQILQAARARIASDPDALQSPLEAFLRQLAWREFAHHLLVHFPGTPTEPLREAFRKFPWRDADHASVRADWRAWCRGRTGYPWIDAGMRELWATGTMHNRVRMAAASFLVKHLRIHWRHGAAWFWDTLVDADLANNTLGWQWVAGCGADAAPYFRIFNPMLQGEKFDPQGVYVAKWVPELRRMPTRWLHRPWEAPAEVLREAGVTLGKDYPRPCIAHEKGRASALAAYAAVKD